VPVTTTLAAIGRLRPALRTACDEYLRRLRRYAPFVERELREAAAARPAADRVRLEGGRLIAAVPEGATVVALDRTGKAWSSEELARRLDRWRIEARPLALLLGGANGLAVEVLHRADAVWSLGPLTLPHELARVVVVEQWYRAWTILRGEPYHR
jgi:23S rRNA (pseudouridine1915-N3)-methyltransferase